MRAAARAADGDRFDAVTAASFGAILLATLCFFFEEIFVMGLGMALFMSGYLTLGALLPAGVTRLARQEIMGAASGAFQTAQFIGAFLGATLTGALWGVDPSAALPTLVVAAGAGLLLAQRLASRVPASHI
jgi:MFS family permease